MRSWETVIREVRQAIRQAIKTPALSAAAIVTLALPARRAARVDPLTAIRCE